MKEVLLDDDKRKIYDETGQIPGEDGMGDLSGDFIQRVNKTYFVNTHTPTTTCTRTHPHTPTHLHALPLTLAQTHAHMCLYVHTHPILDHDDCFYYFQQ